VQAVGDLGPVGSEILRQIQLAVEGENCDLGLRLIKNRRQHGIQPPDSVEFTPCATPRLDRHYQGYWLRLSRLIHLCRLFDAVALDNEIRCMQSVNCVSGYILDQGGDNHNVGLTTKGRFLGESGRGSQEQQGVKAELDDVYPARSFSPSTSSSALERCWARFR
jgi:hypothetical protein